MALSLIAQAEHKEHLIREIPSNNQSARWRPSPRKRDHREYEAGHVSRYQSFRFQKSLSQPLRVALSLFDIAATQWRLTIGITATSSTTMSFILMNSAARLTGSSSPWARRKILSYPSLRQRVGLMPCHLLSFDETSQDTNCCMKRSGSGTEGVPVVHLKVGIE